MANDIGEVTKRGIWVNGWEDGLKFGRKQGRAAERARLRRMIRKHCIRVAVSMLMRRERG